MGWRYVQVCCSATKSSVAAHFERSSAHRQHVFAYLAGEIHAYAMEWMYSAQNPWGPYVATWPVLGVGVARASQLANSDQTAKPTTNSIEPAIA